MKIDIPTNDTPTDIKSSPIPPLDAVTLLTLGGIAGATSKTLIAPADNLKILYQVNPQAHFTIRKAILTGRDIIHKRGPLSLWRGNSATIARVFPYASIVYCTHDFYFHSLSHFHFSDYSSYRAGLSEVQTNGIWRFLAGGCAGITATLLTYPLDLFRARLAASIHASQPGPSTYFDCVKSVYGELGFRGIYSGLIPTLWGIFPYTGISFATYHTLKALYVNNARRLGKLSGDIGENKLPIAMHLLCGGIAALIGQSLTYPLDVVRRRKQVGVFKNESLLACFRIIYRNEGMYGFFRGLTMNWIKGPVASAVSFVVNDRLKHLAMKKKKEYPFL